jgi:hypothetical protein
MKDAFDRGGNGQGSRSTGYLTIPAELHEAVMSLSEAERRNRVRINEAAALPKD